MKQLSILSLVVVGLLLSGGAALANDAPDASNASISNSNRPKQTVVVDVQVSQSQDVPLAADGAWTQIELELDSAPQDARVHHIAVKYVTAGVPENQVSAKLRAQGAPQSYTLPSDASANRVVTESNIETFNGLPVNGTWVLSVRGPAGASGGYVDAVTLKVYFETQMTPLVVTGDGNPGVPSLRTRPTGGSAAQVPSGGKSKKTAPAVTTKPENKPPRAAPPNPPTRRASNAPNDWLVIGAEDFEGVFPTGLWQVADYSNDGYDRYWGRTFNNTVDPTAGYGAWPAAGGADALDPALGSYANNMDTWMTYGPFDLSDATGAYVSFNLWYKTEDNYDWVAVCTSGDTVNFNCTQWSGDSNGWEPVSVNLAPYQGDTSVWVVWQFYSDSSVSNYWGSWVDVIRIAKEVPCYTLTTGVYSAGSGSIGRNPAPNCNNGTQYTSGTVVTLTASANSGYGFINWSGDASGSANPTTVTMSANKNVTANFTVCYTLTTAEYPGGSGSVAANPAPNCGSQYLWGTVVTLTASANSGYNFGSWGYDASGSANPTTVTMSANKNVIANFNACYTLTTAANPGGSGSVAANPTPDCGSQYFSGTVVTLTASANSGYGFINWSGDASGSANPTTVKMSANKNVIANFTACYTLTTAANPGGSGSVAANPAPNCGSQYLPGTVVALTATPASGYMFFGWSGDASGSTNPTNLTMDGNKSVTATFSVPPQVFVDRTWVTNKKNAVVTEVKRKQKVRYFATLRNPSLFDCTVNAVWLVKAKGTTLAQWNGTLTIPPGTSDWYQQKKIPSTAPYRRYKLKVASLCNGVPSTATSKFKVVPSATFAGDDDQDIDGVPVRFGAQ